MGPNGVRALVAAALIVSLLPLAAADATVAPPKCWKGRTGCTHTATPHWNVLGFAGSASVVGTRSAGATCAPAPKEEIVAGRYTVKFALDRKASQTLIGPDAQKNPTTSKSL